MNRFLAASAVIHVILLALIYRSPGAGPAASATPRLAITIQTATAPAPRPPSAASSGDSRQRLAPRATTPPPSRQPALASTEPVDGSPATPQAAPAPHGGEAAASSERDHDDWLSAVRAALAAGKTYPARARLQGREGRVEIRFRVGRDGRLLAAELARSSGHRLLDQAALTLAGEIRVPPPPSTAAAAQVLTFTLDYRLDRQAATASCKGCSNSG